MLLSFIPAAWLLWVFFVAAMRLKQVRDAGKLTLGMKILGYPTLIVGLAIDLFLQLTLANIFLELPREATVSGRLWRLSNGKDGWRKTMAIFIRYQLLDAIDPSGVHTG